MNWLPLTCFLCLISFSLSQDDVHHHTNVREFETNNETSQSEKMKTRILQRSENISTWSETFYRLNEAGAEHTAKHPTNATAPLRISESKGNLRGLRFNKVYASVLVPKLNNLEGYVISDSNITVVDLSNMNNNIAEILPKLQEISQKNEFDNRYYKNNNLDSTIQNSNFNIEYLQSSEGGIDNLRGVSNDEKWDSEFYRRNKEVAVGKRLQSENGLKYSTAFKSNVKSERSKEIIQTTTEDSKISNRAEATFGNKSEVIEDMTADLPTMNLAKKNAPESDNSTRN